MSGPNQNIGAAAGFAAEDDDGVGRKPPRGDWTLGNLWPPPMVLELAVYGY